jgi:hypothetical protein
MIICFFISLALLTGAGIFLLCKYMDRNSRKWFYSFGHYIAAGAVFLAACVLFLPVYYQFFANDPFLFRILKTLILSSHNSIRLFVVDGEYDIFQAYLNGFYNGNLRGFAICYGILSSILYILAPVLTAGIIISLFHNVFSQFRFFKRKGRNFYIFSELNVNSVALAESIYDNEKKSCFVFTDVYDDKTEKTGELLIKIRTIPSAIFKMDITEIDFGKHLKKANVFFIVIGEDEDEKIAQTAGLIERYKNFPNVSIHLVSDREEVEALYAHSDVKFFRIDPSKDMISQWLFEQGRVLFDDAAYENGVKTVSAVIVGLGSYGTNMLKTLSWYLQMDGYESRINAFDGKANAEDLFRAKCPELLDERLNGRKNPEGEARFDIRIHSGIDAMSYSLYEELKKIGSVTFVFVSLGADSLNVKVSRQIRSWLEREGMHPRIITVSYSDELGRLYNKMTTKDGKTPYDIQFVGNVAERFSRNVIFHTELQELAEQLHLLNGNSAQEYWCSAYSYESSCASVIHMKARAECNIPGARKDVADMTEEEKRIISVLEHKRWNMYTRSIGYVLGEKRDHLKKTHDCLVPFDDLERVSAKRYENDLSDYEKAVYGGEPAREPVYKDLRASDLHSLSELEEQRRKRREEYV